MTRSEPLLDRHFIGINGGLAPDRCSQIYTTNTRWNNVLHEAEREGYVARSALDTGAC
jgi:hypothetical protein